MQASVVGGSEIMMILRSLNIDKSLPCNPFQYMYVDRIVFVCQWGTLTEEDWARKEGAHNILKLSLINQRMRYALQAICRWSALHILDILRCGFCSRCLVWNPIKAISVIEFSVNLFSSSSALRKLCKFINETCMLAYRWLSAGGGSGGGVITFSLKLKI